MNKYIDCSKVYIDNCEYGLGVFASKDLEIGEIIENGLMTPLKDMEKR